MVHIGVIGANGRMGRHLVQAVMENEACKLSLATCRKGSTFVGVDAGELIAWGKSGVQITDNIEEHINNADIIIDFTSPKLTMELLALCQKYRKGLVTGTTGFSETEKKAVVAASEEIPVVFSPNMSPSVNLMFSLVAEAAQALGDHYDVEIIEKHHRNKLDAPSGTALKIGESIAQATGRSLEKCAVYGRYGIEKSSRSRQEIGFSAIRAGDVIGEHTALFAGNGEELEITHKSSSRSNYARGAVQAALWLHKKTTGMYSMMDVLKQ